MYFLIFFAYYYASKCVSLLLSSLKIWENWYQLQRISITAKTWGRLITLDIERISCFPLNDSNINIIDPKSISPIYQIYPLICINKESIYILENIIKLISEYTIGSGKTGTWLATSEWGWEYSISIPIRLSFPYTWPQNKDQIYHTTIIKRNESTTPSIYRTRLLFSSLARIYKTIPKPNIAPKREKLNSDMTKNCRGSLINFISFHLEST